MPKNDRFSQNQKRFLTALLAHARLRDAAAAAGVSEATAYRYLRDTAFRAELSRAQDDALSEVTRQCVAAATEAVQTLAAIAGDTTAPAGARVQAARAILESALRFAEVVDLAQRVSELENRTEVTNA